MKTKPKTNPASHYKGIRIKPELLDAAKRRAKALGRNFSNYIKYLVKKDLGLIDEGVRRYRDDLYPSDASGVVPTPTKSLSADVNKSRTKPKKPGARRKD
jgi:hypothetical protein